MGWGSIKGGYIENMPEVYGEAGRVEMTQNVAMEGMLLLSIRQYKASESIRIVAHEKTIIASAVRASELLVQLT